jgi:hypothetical protein
LIEKSIKADRKFMRKKKYMENDRKSGLRSKEIEQKNLIDNRKNAGNSCKKIGFFFECVHFLWRFFLCVEFWGEIWLVFGVF